MNRDEINYTNKVEEMAEADEFRGFMLIVMLPVSVLLVVLVLMKVFGAL